MIIKDKKKLARVIATWVVTAVMLSVFILDIAVVRIAYNYTDSVPVSDEAATTPESDDRIHFLNTANSDCILIESNGRFALVDSGEGNENPRRKTEYKGYLEEVLSYIKKVATKDDGKAHLDFIVATHMHYDHSGNFEQIIKDDSIIIEKAFIKEYDGSLASEMDSEKWGNKATYEKIINALNNKNIEIVNDIPKNEFDFHDFRMKFINTETLPEFTSAGENANSIGIIISKGSKKAFLAADFTNDAGFEMTFAEEIGDIDLLKIGHHGYYGSSSKNFLKTLKPEIAICTNYIGKIYPNVKWNLTMVANTPVFSTAHRDGIIATFTDKDEISLTEKIM